MPSPFIDDRTQLPPVREIAFPKSGELPKKIDPSRRLDERLDVSFPGWPIRDQGRPPNCVAFSAIACFEHFLYGRPVTDGSVPNRPAYSAQFLIYMIKRRIKDQLPDSGYTYLYWAYRALEKYASCPETLCPYSGGIVSLRPPTAKAEAKAKAVVQEKFPLNVYYRDLLNNNGKMHAARQVYECLRQNMRPVAASFPLFPLDVLSPINQTNWTTAEAFHHGEVCDPRAGMDRIGEHCVCITGFVPGRTKRTHGYFIFRNSWGTQWAQFAPGTLPGPVSPGPGYGIVSETYVDKHCKELLQLY
jgi:hypothetical protein